jgi:small subunit ribosomal protein S11
MDKDVRAKRDVIRTALDAKFEDTDTDTTYVEGLTEAGITVPTQETMSMLIDGVPYNELPIVHIKSSLNNTIIHVTDHAGVKFIARSSCGQEGFKNVKKSTNVAAQATGLSLGIKVLRMGIRNVRIVLKGLGAGRLASIKGLQMGGLNVVSITDNTHVPHDAPRPRKAKRL